MIRDEAQSPPPGPPASVQMPRRLVIGLAIGLCALTFMVSDIPFVWAAPAALGVGLLGGAVAFRAPYLVCLCFVVLSYFRLHEAYPLLEPFRFPQLFAIATLGLMGLLLMIGRLQVFVRREHVAFVIFALLVVLGLPLSTSFGESWATFTDNFIKIIVMMFALSFMCRSERDFKITAYAMMLAGAAVAAIAISNMVQGIELIEGTRVTIGRSRGAILGDPNDLAAILSFALAFAITALLRADAPLMLRVLGFVSALMLLTAIVGTQSRGSLLGVAVLLAILAYDRVRSKILVGAAGVIGLVLLLSVSGISDRQTVQVAEGAIVDESAQGRLIAWQTATNMALAHPVTGVGIGNFYHNYYQFTPEWDGKNHAVHSTWFEVLAETGFPGLIAFVVMIVLNFRTLLGLRRADRNTPRGQKGLWHSILTQAVFAGFVSFLVSGTFLTHAFTWPIYILIAFTIALARTTEASHDNAKRRRPAPHHLRRGLGTLPLQHTTSDPRPAPPRAHPVD